MDRFARGLKTRLWKRGWFAERGRALKFVGYVCKGRRDRGADGDEHAKRSDRNKQRDHRVFDRGGASVVQPFPQERAHQFFRPDNASNAQ